MIENNIYDTRTLMGVLRDNDSMQPPESYWLDLCFPNQVNFDDEYVDFSRLAGQRKIAPLVVPTAQGKPIYSAAEARSRFKPAYVKPKDPITATRMIRRAAGLGELDVDGVGLSPQARYNAIVADIMREHRWAIERRWEWLACQAVTEGKVILEDEAYPRTLVDFQRDPDHSITLGAGARWGDAGVSILRSIESMTQLVRKAKFGGPANRLTIGADVWDVMRDDDELREAMNNNYRGNRDTNINLGVRDGLDVEFVGNISGTLPVYVYSDYYQDYDGTVIEMMNSKDVVITGNNVNGVRAFGAIQDKAASWQPLSIFPKMWDQEDPSATFIMNQSAPLMVPVNPNATAKARVIA